MLRFSDLWRWCGRTVGQFNNIFAERTLNNFQLISRTFCCGDTANWFLFNWFLFLYPPTATTTTIKCLTTVRDTDEKRGGKSRVQITRYRNNPIKNWTFLCHTYPSEANGASFTAGFIFSTRGREPSTWIRLNYLARDPRLSTWNACGIKSSFYLPGKLLRLEAES